MSLAEMAERRKQGLCYYCDEKYSPGHKCKEHKFFQIDATDYSSTEEDPPLEEQEAIEEDNQKEIVSDEPVISLNALAGISSPQTLKIRGFLKHRRVVVLIDSGSTHNFIHQKVAEAVHCFVRAVSNFQVQIADGGTMKCEGHCENVKLQMGDYQLKTHMFAIHMGGCDIVLGDEWLHTLGPITMDFQELYMSFKQKNYTHTLRGLQAGAPSIISSHRMEKLLKKGHRGVIAQFNAVQAFEPTSLHIHPEMQQSLNNHFPVFDKPHELPPSRGEHD
ncbi:retropepsin-like aspartic protease, partial [Actinobacillus pleuropneumoniae]|uniref:retropepsin-like aspartic protease n=1 Tax=Actinobacillus pleuropneumoniae TaxID=715 RepID=UPI00227AB32D